MHQESPLWTVGSDQQANHQVQQGSDSTIKTQVRIYFKYKKDEGNKKALDSWCLPTSERNNLSNNLTSTMSGSIPGEGAATQWRTPCIIFNLTRKNEIKSTKAFTQHQINFVVLKWRFTYQTGNPAQQWTLGFVFFEGSYSARISRIVSLSSARITSVHFMGNAYLQQKKKNSQCIVQIWKIWLAEMTIQYMHTWVGQIYPEQAHSNPLNLSSGSQNFQCI